MNDQEAEPLNAIRIILRLLTLVLAISAAIVILAGGIWYVWQGARSGAPDSGYTITARRIERAVLGLYLRQKADQVESPAVPGSGAYVTFVVDSGQSVTTISNNLVSAGLISDAEIFRRVVQYWGADEDIQAGAYSLSPGMTMEEIMREMQHGRLPTVRLTIPEGWRAQEIAALLEQVGLVTASDFMAQISAGSTLYDYLADRPAGASASLEGYLFPDTYQLPENATSSQIVQIMLGDYDARVTPEMRQQAADAGLTLYEVMTLASIVEREAVIPEERPLIAGVYLNRLAAGMRLEADPTVQYGKGYDAENATWWPQLTIDDLQQIDSPYNTYTHDGLPPGPICNPGLASIQAVLSPEPSDYLFFVHKGDGSHAFAVTFEEHLENIAAYQ